MSKLGKNYRLLWSAYSVSTLGTYLSLIVMNLFIYQATKSPLLVGVFLLLRLVPSFFMGNVAGVLADRFDRRRLIITADLARALLIFSVIFLRENIYPLYFIITLMSICDRLYQSAMGGSIPNIAGQENIVAANSYLATGRTFALISGPLIGGALISFQNYALAFGIDALTYLFSATMFYLITAKFHSAPPAKQRINILRGIKEGYVFIWANVGLFSIILIRCLDAFGSSAINVGTPIFADGLEQFSAGVCYGLMYASFGAGEMVGSLIIARTNFVRRRPPELVVGVSILFMGLFFGIAFSRPDIYFTMAFMMLSGLAEGVTAVTYNVYLQKNPDDIRGRIVGTSETSVWSTMAIGMFLSGLIAEKIPIGSVVQIFAGIIVAGCIVHLVLWRRKTCSESGENVPEAAS